MNLKNGGHTNWTIWYIGVLVFLLIQIILYNYLTDIFR